MRRTIALSLNNDLMTFIHQQKGVVDPSAFINKLILDDMRRNGFHGQEKRPASKTDDALENMLDGRTDPRRRLIY